jgi:hypothetical protein
MRFVLQALMVFFATLAVAALVALGDPGDSGWIPFGDSAAAR